jgi:hypothetical protein
MSFNFVGIFRVGSYKVFRRFVAHELRDAESRLEVIRAELTRIGSIEIVWEKTQDDTFIIPLDAEDDEDIEQIPVERVSERRVGLIVDGPLTTIGKLCQAYIAQGGNPFDISMFMDPVEGMGTADDTGTESEFKIVWKHPSGGIAYPRTREDIGGGSFQDGGGKMSINKDPKLRLGDGISWDKAEDYTGHYIAKAREWITQEVREKRNDLEWRIIKQMDLREQLRTEMDHLIYRAANGMFAETTPDNESQDMGLSVPAILHHIDDIIFAKSEELGNYDIEVPVIGYRGTGDPYSEVINSGNLARGEFDVIWENQSSTDGTYEVDAWTGL